MEPRLAGVPHPLETDEVFQGDVAERIAEVYRAEAEHDESWGEPRGIEWTV